MNKLLDMYGRMNDYLRLSLTDRCNFQCYYCMPDGLNECMGTKSLMTKEEIAQIAGLFVKEGVKKIRLTGGEPLVRKEAANIILLLGKLPVELAITTNGYLVDQYIEVFQKAGLKNINVSLDSLQEDRFAFITKRNALHRILNNIDLLISHQFHVKINVVVIKNKSEDEITDFVNWTLTKPVHVRFIEFMPFKDNGWQMEQVVTHSEILDRIKSRFKVSKLRDSTNDTAKNYRAHGAKGTFAVISSISEPFCSSCNRLRLLADGKMKNCLFSSSETDLLTTFRQGKDISPLIRKCVLKKADVRGGQVFNDQYSNGSMFGIGG